MPREGLSLLNSESSQSKEEERVGGEGEEEGVVNVTDDDDGDLKSACGAPAVPARHASDSDYARYRAACKVVDTPAAGAAPGVSANPLAEAFYSRLAALQALHSYGFYLSHQHQHHHHHHHPSLTLPSLVSHYHQQQQQHLAALQQAAAAAAATQQQQQQSPPIPSSPTYPPSQQTSPLSPLLLSPPFRSPNVNHSPSSSSSSGGRKRDSSSSSSPSSCSGSSPSKKPRPSSSSKRSKASRRLAFDDYLTSPVSGTIIRELAEGEEIPAIRKGDIDPEFNVVEVTEEAKAELAKIENKIGDFVCRLCRERYEDAFGLAQHRCSMIVHVEYRCPECDKVFNCPANLASHRRWHKPKNGNVVVNAGGGSGNNNNYVSAGEDSGNACGVCGKIFKKSNTLRKHVQGHHHNHHQGCASRVANETNNNVKASPGKSCYSIDQLLSPSKKTSPPSPTTNNKNWSCKICLAEFQTSRDLQNHCFEQCSPPKKKEEEEEEKVDPQEDEDEQLIRCPVCPQLTFGDVAELSRHASEFHLLPQQLPAVPAAAATPPSPPPLQRSPLFGHTHHHQFARSHPAPPPLLSIAALASRS